MSSQEQPVSSTPKMSPATKELLARVRMMIPPMLEKFHKGEDCSIPLGWVSSDEWLELGMSGMERTYEGLVYHSGCLWVADFPIHIAGHRPVGESRGYRW